MEPELRRVLVERGMPPELTDQQAVDWMAAEREELFDTETDDDFELDEVDLEEIAVLIAEALDRSYEREREERTRERQELFAAGPTDATPTAAPPPADALRDEMLERLRRDGYRDDALDPT